MDELKTIPVETLIFNVSFKQNNFDICEVKTRMMISLFFKEIYEQLKENDEIVLGNIGGEFYSIKRTPTIAEEQEILDRSKMIVSQGEEKSNFKVFFVKKKEEE